MFMNTNRACYSLFVNCKLTTYRANSLIYAFHDQIPEYCRTMDEAEILDNAFNLLFAFDEVVALGYRESVNLAQIRWAEHSQYSQQEGTALE